MPVKDQSKHFGGLAGAPAPAEVQVPNSVSRHLKVGDRSFDQVVTESAKPLVDADLNLAADAQWMRSYLYQRWQVPSGFLRGTSRHDAYCDYTLGTAPSGLDDALGTAVHGDGTLLDSLVLPRLEAVVAGYPLIVEYTNTATPDYNLITLEAPTIYDGTNATVKRTDFVFLEVWKALVAPSPRASGYVEVVAVADLVAGDKITIAGTDLVAVAAAPGADEFEIGATEDITAKNIADAINDVGNSFATSVVAVASTNFVIIKSRAPGLGSAGPPPTGNSITLSVTVTTAGSLLASGATLTGGEDRPNKPATAQDKLYRHGNVQSPEDTWLDDELVDPSIDQESSQRVQIQYRIRATGASEAVNPKDHPDGFSNTVNTIYAQGGRSLPVYNGNANGDTRSYPFVPADGTSTWHETSAVAYGLTDDGLWVAGDGSEQAAQDLGSVDGYVYAIPICFVFRHNNCSDATAAIQGWDPENNANGAPVYDHVGYAGVLGTIPAGLSDRPDGEFCDVITTNNLLDLRRHVVPGHLDLKAELTYQMQSLLDGSLRTWAVDTASKQILGGNSGDVSTRFLVCNEVGRAAAVGGNTPSSGDTGRGEVVRNFDHIARRFADQPVVERVVFGFWPGDRPSAVAQGGVVAPGTENAGKYVVKAESSPGVPVDDDAWYEGDILHLDLTALNVTTLGGLFQGADGGGGSGTGLPSEVFSTFAPAGTVITDVLGVYHDDGHYTNPVDQSVQVKFIMGLGTQHVQIMLDANDLTVNGGVSGNPDYQMVGRSGGAAAGSPRRIFVEFEVTYPVGVGLTDTFQHDATPDASFYDGSAGAGPGPLVEADITQRPNDLEDLLAPRFRQGYREVQFEYVANDTDGHAALDQQPNQPVGSVNPETLVSADQWTLYFPRRVYGGKAVVVTDAVDTVDRGVDSTQTEYGSSSRKVVLNTLEPLSGAGQTLCKVQYFAQDPVPNYGVSGGGYQVGFYYRTNAPQTAGVKEGEITTSGDGVLPSTLKVEPLVYGDVWTGQRGMGSHDLGFPYSAPLDQIPVNDGSALDGDEVAGTTKEWYFSATAQVTVDDFEASTGLLTLHPYVQADVQEILTLGGETNDTKPRKDAEFRAYYPFADDTTYRPTILSEPLYGAVRHKVMVPVLCRATEDVPGVSGGLLFRKNELLLVVLTRFAELDDENNVRFTDSANRTSAAVYRTRNLLMVVGDRNCP